MEKVKVFISHSSLDSGWARDFANSLEQSGHEVVWSDSSATRPEQSWRRELEKGLRESDVIVLLVTPDTINSPNLFLEIGAAIGMDKPLLLVTSKDVDPSALPVPLRGRRYLVKGSPEATAREFVSQQAMASQTA
jgi:hypothetical protein